MSTKYPGGIITKNYTPPTTSSASGIWTLDQQDQAQQAGIWPSGGPFNYIEDMFSTYLYTGNGSTQSINNGIDLSTKGGMVWTKCRSNGQNNWIFDTVRGANSPISTNTNDSAADAYATYFDPATNIVLANTTGYSLAQTGGGTNTNGFTYAGWTFRKQPKFFDVVTYTGTGSAQSIAHNLGSVPGCIIVKNISVGYNWQVYHKSLTSSAYSIQLNQTAGQSSQPTIWNSTDPTSTNFTVGTSSATNGSGNTFVAYLFASNAGGFGLTGTDNVISCGSFNCDSSGIVPTVTLGYEPQWILVKRTDTTQNWFVFDTLRGFNYSGLNHLQPNTSDAEAVYSGQYLYPTATGFSGAGNLFGASASMIYIAIRRGPMKVPTDATTVFSPNITSNDSNPITTNFPVDFYWDINRAGNSTNSATMDRLRGSSVYLSTSNTNAEANSGAGSSVFTSNTTVTPNFFLSSVVVESFRRAPSFFDEVCYTGTGSNMTISHNLGAVPELMIVKMRSTATFTGYWYVYASAIGNTKNGYLNDTISFATSSGAWNNTTPTASSFYVGTDFAVSETGKNFVAYLFSTCAGVSKVGSYTGNGTTQTINCGFTGGARFVLIKRTDATGDWYTYDTARGMTTLTDPYLLLNSTAAETATLGSVTTVSTGFALNSTILAAINVSGGTYIFLAIA